MEDSWEVLEMDINLVTRIAKTFSYTSDDNDIALTFDATDRSGNMLEGSQTEMFTIDKTPPEISVVFREDISVNNFYYNSNRIADITVIERNFDPNLIGIAIENEFGIMPSTSFTSISETEHVAVIIFGEGDYTFDVSGTDLGNHSAAVDFSGGNERYFFVDKTPPVVIDDFDALGDSSSRNIFNTDKTVTISITERNFAHYLNNLRVKMKDAGSDHANEDFNDATYFVLRDSDWVTEGDVHTISFTLHEDGVYQIEIEPIDLAGNSSDYRSSAVFEIDKTPPIVIARNGYFVNSDDTEFLDIYTYPRKNEPAPTIEFFDTNIDHIRYNLTVYVPDYTSTEAVTVIKPVRVYSDEDADRSGSIMGSLFTMPNFVNDGIYSLELIAVDEVGNESHLNKNTYVRMIEQDVLAYILESNVEEGTGLYSFQYENGIPISKRPDNFSDIKILVFAQECADADIVLRDYNADEINTYSQAETDNSIYGISISDIVLKSEFFSETFQDDTDTELLLTVKSGGGRIDLGILHIDNRVPSCDLPDVLKSWYWFFGDSERTITISGISEMLDESQCRVFNNGVEIDFVYSWENDTIAFTLDKGWHNIGVILTDMAGNAYNIPEVRNIHIGFFWLWIIVAASCVIILASAVVVASFIKAKRKTESA